MFTVGVSDALIAKRAGYVYALFAPRFAAAYVGQTYASDGAIGRLTQHIGFGVSATFRRRLCEHFGFDDLDLGPIHFEACLLGDLPTFHTRIRDHREAVEALAQYGLLNRIYKDGYRPCVIISRVTLNKYAQSQHVREAAELVVERLYSRAREIREAPTWGNC